MKGRTTPVFLVASALLASAAESVDSAATRTVSPQTAARLKTDLPRFAPPPVPAPSVPAPLASPNSVASRDSGDTSGPGDDIVRLPRYEVRERALPPLRERDLLTPSGRIALVQKRHPGLKLGPLSRLNMRRGLEMLAEEEQVERTREMSDLMDFQRFVAATRAPRASPTRVASE